jgi:hypothetical protein
MAHKTSMLKASELIGEDHRLTFARHGGATLCAALRSTAQQLLRKAE